MDTRLAAALHLLGMVFWIGTLLYSSRLLREYVRAAAQPTKATLYRLARRTQLYAGLPAMVLTLAMGVVLLLKNPGSYFAQGWFHGKLTGAILLTGLECWLFVLIRRYKTKPGSAFLPLLIHMLTGLVVIAIVAAVKLR